MCDRDTNPERPNILDVAPRVRVADWEAIGIMSVALAVPGIFVLSFLYSLFS